MNKERKLELNSHPSDKGFSIRQYIDPNDPSFIPGPVNTAIFLDGKRLDTVQGIKVGFSIDDITCDVQIVMLATSLDIDILDANIELKEKAEAEHSYVIGRANPQARANLN
jgi:hypothetical protein